MSIASIFLPQIKRQVAKKFNVDKDAITSIEFFVDKVGKSIKLQCNTKEGALATTISENEISMASDAVEKAVRSKIKGELFAYSLEINMDTKTFNAVIYCSNEKGEKIALPINNIF
jgi:hypothetical protein